MDRSAFFASLKKRNSGIFGTSLSQSQVDGLNVKLDVWAKWYASKYPATFLAAALGQCYRETGGQMRPILETHSAKNPCTSRAQAARRLEAAFKAGKLTWVKTRYWNPDASGQIGVGGGDIQLTHRANYVKANEKIKARFGVDIGLDDDYDKVLDPVVSAVVMFQGMIDGWFIGNRLSDYANKQTGALDYYNARDIVNGDKKHIGKEIVTNCQAFEAALRAAGAWSDFGLPEKDVLLPGMVADAPVSKPVPTPASPDWGKPINRPAPAPAKSGLAALIAAIVNAFSRKRK